MLSLLLMKQSLRLKLLNHVNKQSQSLCIGKYRLIFREIQIATHIPRNSNRNKVEKPVNLLRVSVAGHVSVACSRVLFMGAPEQVLTASSLERGNDIKTELSE